jgi:hypothetical protein
MPRDAAQRHHPQTDQQADQKQPSSGYLHLPGPPLARKGNMAFWVPLASTATIGGADKERAERLHHHDLFMQAANQMEEELRRRIMGETLVYEEQKRRLAEKRERERAEQTVREERARTLDIEYGDATRWLDQPVPDIPFLVAELIPDHSVVLLAGDGGSGKSILGQTLATCIAAGLPFVGYAAASGRAVFITAEDRDEILHVRQVRICKALGLTFADLADKLFVVSRADDDLFLFTHGSATPLLRALEGELAALGGVRLVVIDSAALVFDDNEIERRPVAAFMRGLNRLALRLGCTIILVAHTSRSSDRSAARMASGSTAWAYQARAGLLLSNDEDGALLEPLKANYARRGLKVELRWTEDGVLVAKGAPGMVERIGDNSDGKRIAETVGKRWDERNPMSAHPQAGGRYLPAVMAALDPPLKPGRAEKLMKQMIARGEIIDDPTGKRPGLRLPSQEKKA